jgi:chemosensory pili system protein ChpA (sensor histidine kinase/response regulator)
VQIGTVRLSPALYKVYLEEAEQRLGHMLASFDELRADHPMATVSEAFVHEAHTLAGISGTTGFTPVYRLGEQLELVLQHLHRAPVPLEQADRELIGRTLAALSSMIDCVRRRTPPEAAPHLVDALEALPRKLEAGAAHARASGVTANGPVQLDFVTPAAASGAEAPAGEPRPDAVPTLGEDSPPTQAEDQPDEALLPLFLQEAADLIPQVGHWLREWRGQRDSPEIPAALQRLLHTLKGSARMAGAMAVGELTHSMESRVEGAMRTPVIPDALLNGLEASLDRLGLLIDRLQHPEQRGAAAQADGGAGVGTAPKAQQQPMLRVRAALVDRLVNEAGELAVTRARANNEVKGLRHSLTDLTDSIIRLRAQVREIEIQAESQIQSRVAVARDGTESAFDPLEFDRYTRLQELTRFLAESVNDLATVQHGMLERVDACAAGLTAQAQITRVLQDELLGMRLTPVATLTERLYRVARLTARETGKPTRFDIVGGQVEMDRAIIERMAGLIEHLVRNAIVHGLEDADGRRAAGKPETGQVTLEVRQEGNEVLLMVSDDGAGLNLERIRRKALELGVIATDQPLSEAEIGNLIFAAGVSTASEVTQAAGRGVGLDAVRSEVSAAGGRVEVKFERGRGSRFLIHLPVTLSVLHALVVRCAERPYALPAQMVDQVRTLRPEALEQAYTAGAVSFQGREYPLYHLQHLLGDPEYAPLRQRFNPLVLVHSGTDRLALHVDALAGNQEIVIKGIGEQVARVTGITGAAMLGTGEAVLILNPVLLVQGRTGAGGTPAWRQPQAPAMAPLRPVVMVVDDSITVRKITGRLLAREGYEAVEARDGVDALERIGELRPDVVLTDIEMPRMDGFDLVRQLRGDARWRDVPVIVISSRTADKHRALARELGADVFLGKPYHDEELLAQIARLIEASAAEPAQQEPRG